MIEIQESTRNRRTTLIGNYFERRTKLNARVISVISTYGDAVSIFGVVSDDNDQFKNFSMLCDVLNAIASSLAFFPPKAPSPYETLPGRYLNGHGTVLELSRDRQFQWYGDEINEKFGYGRWDRMGNSLEGEIILFYDNSTTKNRARFVVVDTNFGVIKVDDVLYQRQSNLI
jgi:hypothetical protein